MRMSRKSRTPSVTAAAPGTIGFRLDERSRTVLSEQAAQMNVSPHELARIYVIERLQGNDDAIHAMIYALRGDLLRTREDLATLAEALLTTVGNQDPKTVHKWIDENMKSPPLTECYPFPNQ